jgi:hypothetical protein
MTPVWLFSAYALATMAFLLAAYSTMSKELRGSLRRLPGISGLRIVAAS